MNLVTVRLKEGDFFGKRTVQQRNAFLRPPQLQEVADYRAQESLLVRDMLYVLVGLEGSYVRFRSEITGFGSFSDYKLALHLDESLKAICRRLLVHGMHYGQLAAFAEEKNRPEFGRCCQSLCGQILAVLAEQQLLVGRLEAEFRGNGRFSLTEFLGQLERAPLCQKLAVLYTVASEVHKNQNSDHKPSVLDHLDLPTDPRGVSKGGLVLKTIQDVLAKHRGDPVAEGFLFAVHEAVAEPYVRLMNQWLVSGSLDDPFGDFFISENPAGVFRDRLWQERFLVAPDGAVPQFAGPQVLQRILATGRCLNMVKMATGVLLVRSGFPEFAESVPENPVLSVFAADAELLINHCHSAANRLLLHVIFDGFSLRKVVASLHRSVFSSHGLEIHNFLQKSYHDLARKPTSHLAARMAKGFPKQPFLAGLLVENESFYETALRILAIEPIKAQELLGQPQLLHKVLRELLLLRALANSDNSDFSVSAIHRISLGLSLPFPLTLAVSDAGLFKYNVLFRLHVLLKFISYDTDVTWMQLNKLAVWRAELPEQPKRDVLRCRILVQRSKAFLAVIQDYMAHTVAQSNYGELETEMGRFEEDLRGPWRPVPRAEGDYVQLAPRANRLFDQRLSALSAESGNSDRDVAALTAALGNYLDASLRDLLVRSPQLLHALHEALAACSTVNRAVAALKKTLILMNETQYAAFVQDYPDRFAGQDMSPELVQIRAGTLHDVVAAQWLAFHQSVAMLVAQLHAGGAASNNDFMNLIERLQHFSRATEAI